MARGVPVVSVMQLDGYRLEMPDTNVQNCHSVKNIRVCSPLTSLGLCRIHLPSGLLGCSTSSACCVQSIRRPCKLRLENW